MVHLYPQVTKSSDLFDVESAFKEATEISKNDASGKKTESIENGRTDRNEKTAPGNDQKASDRTNKCIRIFCTWIIPFILLLSVGSYLGYNYEQRIHELTEANRICQASKTEQEDRFNRVIAEYEQLSMDYANEMGNYARRMDAKMRKEGATMEERRLPKKGADEINYDMADYGGGYSETNGPVSEPHTEIRIIHISTKGANGKYGFSYRNTYITYVEAGSPACLCGVKEGDEILSIDGEKVETQEDVDRLGWKETGITLELRSKVSLADPPTRIPSNPPIPRAQTRFVTMGRSDVGGWESIYGFYHSGTTITGVVPGSSMEQNGVKMGDEIVTIDAAFVRSHADVGLAIEGKDEVTFEIRPQN